jgi:hypothetical protein
MGEARGKAGSDFSHACGVKMLKLDPVLLPRLPAGKRSPEFRLALVDFEVTLLAQHRHGARLLQERLQFCFR